MLALFAPVSLEAQGLRARISVKRILDALDTLPTDGFFYQDAQVERALDAANQILLANGADWQLELIEIVNLTGLSEWYNISGHLSSGLENRAMSDPARYAWRDDAINIYVTRLSDWRGFCSIPDGSGSTDIIVINNDAWFIPPFPLPPSSLPEESDLDLAAGYLWLHEIGHYFNLCHTQGCCCGFVCGNDQDPTRDPFDHDRVDDTLDDRECWGVDNISQWSFGVDFAQLSESAQQQVNDTLLNVMSYHREDIFAADGAILTEGQLARMEVEMTRPIGRRSHVMAYPQAEFVLRPFTVDVLRPVEADGSTSTTVEGREIVSWDWDFGDGTQMSGETVTYRFAEAGLYLVRLTVGDSFGVESVQEKSIFVTTSTGNVGSWTSTAIGDGASGSGLFDNLCAVTASDAFGFGTDDDSFFFLHRPFEGDVCLTARIDELRTTVSGGEVGVLIRDGLEPDGHYTGAFVEVNGAVGGSVGAVWRTRAEGGTVRFARGPLPADGWVRVERRGVTISSYLSEDGADWRWMGTTDAPFPGVVEIGIGIAGGVGEAGPEVFLSSLCEVRLERLVSRFRRGDFDGSGLIDITDVLLLLQYLILGDGEVICADASDANDDGLVDVTDALFTLLVIFISGEIPAPGMFECGEDPSDDEIGCGNYRAPCM